MRLSGSTLLAPILFASAAAAACPPPAPLEGTITLETCDPKKPGCHSAEQQLSKYLARTERTAGVWTVALQSSPWRFYDPDMRIMSPEALADRLRPHRKKQHEKMLLVASWTGVAPPGGRSLADKLSSAMDLPVDGLDGFLWVTPEGGLRTTRQAFTARSGGGAYALRDGDDVMVAQILGDYSMHEAHWSATGDAEAMLRAGVGWDVFGLCPESALAAFEKAAEMGNAVAAFNAAMVRLEQGSEDDRAAAVAWLEKAAKSGDVPSAEHLKRLAGSTASQ